MNLHPLFVHFPIALLSVYALLEMLRFRGLQKNEAWFYVKAAFLLFGTGGAFMSILTGDLNKDAYRDQALLLRTHETFAKGTAVVFGLLCVYYGIELLDRWLGPRLVRSPLAGLWHWSRGVSQKIFQPWLVVPLALVGLGGLFITGALGGTLVYGSDTDIFTRIVNHLLFPQ